MGYLKQKKNKRYNYTPRYYKSNGEGSPFEIKHKFDDYRTTLVGNKNIKQKFTSAWDEFKNSPDKAVNRRVLVIGLVLVFLFLLIIDFDLTLFF
ncbi:riboflavin synthase subunit beta [Bizionia gelidisalsuginis]|uniref:Riboflavin synthase subunit beta n=2 Tax=Bizionia TaxID=283785 RepID=A0A8H2QKG7_9FLAO|nr:MULTISPECIES: riboflavin synthase subunit beta [Bizionia]TYB70501.1 riboflavin synthase subunit beta [Bizionia saleffrena]TYC10649.1 riboflavin synthase subunit beta [Bizionia gelidisalsuginis]